MISRGNAFEGYESLDGMASIVTDRYHLENLLRGIYAYGYESPSAVQSRAIVQICKGRDTIAQAQSGTGKTATFSISILQVIDTAVRETQGTVSILLSPLSGGADQRRYSAGSFSNSRTCHADPVCDHGPGRLHECAVPRMHWWDQRRGRHS